MKSVIIGLLGSVSLAATAIAEPILTVSGVGEPIAFEMEQIQALEASSFTTETIWTEGAQTFEGVSLATLIAELGVDDGTIIATAINEYAVEIPISDAIPDGPIIAYMRNGELMSVRDKGPLWIVYPYDSDTNYQTEVIYSRSIWQLDRITISE